MKHGLSFLLLSVVGVAVLGGCPIYPSDRQNRVCDATGACFSCPDVTFSDDCVAWTCETGDDCPAGFSCTTDRSCQQTGGLPPNGPSTSVCSKPGDCLAPQTCGADNRCHAGDCSTTGCPSTYVCKLASGTPACVPVGASSSDGGASQATCSLDADCASPAGSKCLSGSCVAPSDQCADTTQCQGSAQCVQGACTPDCSATKACPTGYSCDTGKGVCTGNTTPCTSSTQCTGTTTCVEQHCVDDCGTGGTCPTGLVCVDGGCIPDEKPTFTCATDGVQDNCQSGSICLRHSCYIACDPDAGADACKNADAYNVCKTVTTSSGPHSVCGSDTNLGTECDPTQGLDCASPLVCIDGFCR